MNNTSSLRTPSTHATRPRFPLQHSGGDDHNIAATCRNISSKKNNNKKHKPRCHKCTKHTHTPQYKKVKFRQRLTAKKRVLLERKTQTKIEPQSAPHTKNKQKSNHAQYTWSRLLLRLACFLRATHDHLTHISPPLCLLQRRQLLLVKKISPPVVLEKRAVGSAVVR